MSYCSLSSRDIFTPRTSLKPFEYPQFEKFIKAINHSFWTVDEYNFQQDIQDFKVNLSDVEREIIKRTMLAISTIEVKVKNFYGISVPLRFPKPEIQALGSTFSENEVRHELAYSHLLELLGFNEAFREVESVPAIEDRLKYLGKYKEWQNATLDKNFLKSLLLFALFIEGTSLMSQFVIMQSFKQYKNLLKGIDTVVNATSREEDLHAKAAFEIINILRFEHPELFTDEVDDLVYKQTEKAFIAERKVLDWIFEKGDLEFLPRDIVEQFLQHRYDFCLTQIHYDPIFHVDRVHELEWFEVSLKTSKSNDFFNTRSVDYARSNKSFEPAELF